MKKYIIESMLFIKGKSPVIDDPELQSVISDVMVYSEDYDINLQNTTDDINNWF